MRKILLFVSLLAGLCHANVIQVKNINRDIIETNDDISKETLVDHFIDFINLIDLDYIMSMINQKSSDPDVKDFNEFIISRDFSDLVWKIESIPEFSEVIQYLKSHGYNAVEKYIEQINVLLGLPAPPITRKYKDEQIENGLSDLIKEIVDSLPTQEMKELFNYKMQNYEKFSTLFDVLTTEEMAGLVVNIYNHPDFVQFKNVFYSYGFDLKYVCVVAKEIAGDHIVFPC